MQQVNMCTENSKVNVETVQNIASSVRVLGGYIAPNVEVKSGESPRNKPCRRRLCSPRSQIVGTGVLVRE